MKHSVAVVFLSIFLLLLTGSSEGHSRDPEFEQISLEHGLSHISVQDIYQCSDGFLWVATRDGLNRFDGYNFLVYRHIEQDSLSVSHNWITAIVECDSNTLWIGTMGGGLNRFDKISETFTRFRSGSTNATLIPNNYIRDLHLDRSGNLWVATDGGLSVINPDSMTARHFRHDPENEFSLNSDSVTCIYEDRSGMIWIGTNGGGFMSFDLNLQRFSHVHCPFGFSGDRIRTIYEDSEGSIWLGTEGCGMSRFDRRTKRFFSYTADLYGSGLKSNTILSIYEDTVSTEKWLWVGTSGGGIHRFDRKNEKFYSHLCTANTMCCLGTNIINAIYADRSGVMWLGTDCCGMNKHTLKKNQVFSTDQEVEQTEGFFNNRALLFYEDHHQNLWIASPDGLQRVNQKSGTIRHFEHDRADTSTIGSNIITALIEDRNGNLWIGSENGLDRYEPQHEHFYHYRYHPRRRGGLSDNGVVSLAQANDGGIWIGTRIGGLNYFDPETGEFTKYHHDPDDPHSIGKTPIMTICPVENGVWLAMYNEGISFLDTQTGKCEHFTHQPADSNSLSHNSTNFLFRDEHRYIWIATNGGLCRFDPEQQLFKTYTDRQGLLDNRVLLIVADDNRNLWLSTSQGLSRFDPVTEEFFNYPLDSGGEINRFDHGAFYRNRNGKFYYGAMDGIHSFHPDQIQDNLYIPPVVVTGFKVMDKAYYIGESIPQAKEIALEYDQHTFSFEFAALDFNQPSQNHYAYMLEGVDPAWVYNRSSRTARFTNIGPGRYVFRVRGTNNQGVWNTEGHAVAIVIAPPWWSTKVAIVFYVMMLGMIITAVWRINMNRVKIRHQMEIDHLKTEKLEEMDRLKSRFFANISHEFRTPLSLIMGPVENILSKTNDLEERKDLKIARRYARRLQNLVEQLLDLSKIEAGTVKLKTVHMNVTDFLREIILSFASMTEKKKIQLKLQIKPEPIFIYADPEKFERIIINILSNALKFTPVNGQIDIRVNEIKNTEQVNGDDAGHLEIVIADSGPGIPPDKVDRIFDRFYQVDTSQIRDHEGTGIGLALTKELVELHHGKIVAETHPDHGVVIRLLFLLGRHHLRDEQIVTAQKLPIPLTEKYYDGLEDRVEIKVSHPHERKHLPRLLIVEDNTDLRQFIGSFLSDRYRILEAENGEEGFAKTIKYLPDLIISDIKMPVMDGLNLCQKIKHDERTSHIPFILLTVHSSETARIRGLTIGADDYIVKPFNARELRQRVDNLIAQRRYLRERFSREYFTNPEKFKMNKTDQDFIRRLIDVIREKIDDPNLTVDELTQLVGASRTHLHRKIHALTGLSTSNFIRNVRLQRAAEILREGAGSVLDVAYSVGFNHLSYFARCFTQEFGRSPSEYLHHFNSKKV